MSMRVSVVLWREAPLAPELRRVWGIYSTRAFNIHVNQLVLSDLSDLQAYGLGRGLKAHKDGTWHCP